MLKQLTNHITQNNLCAPNHKILLAVSGGMDSVAMLHLFKEAGYAVSVAHCNFQLRGSEAVADEVFVKNLCQSLNVPFFIKRFETEGYAAQHQLSTQMAARELRYAWFTELLDEHGLDYLATAHHLNDSIETVLMNWIHGASLEAFSGIPVKHGRIIRPMLFADRQQIEQFAQEKKFQWREDASNQTDAYQRNFLRHQVIPKLKELNPSLEATFLHGQKKIVGELLFLEVQIEKWKKDNLKKENATILIEKSALLDLPYAESMLWKVVKEYGFNIDQCQGIVQALQGQSGKKFISESHLLTIDRNHLIISGYDYFDETINIHTGDEEIVRGSWSLIQQKQFSSAITGNPMTALLDADKITYPIQWRNWQAGDYFYPLGMEHRKKLSDFFIDKKISLSEKNGITVLESAGQIIWVVGQRIDNRYKITPETNAVLSLSVRPYFS